MNGDCGVATWIYMFDIFWQLISLLHFHSIQGYYTVWYIFYWANLPTEISDESFWISPFQTPKLRKYLDPENTGRLGSWWDKLKPFLKQQDLQGMIVGLTLLSGRCKKLNGTFWKQTMDSRYVEILLESKLKQTNKAFFSLRFYRGWIILSFFCLGWMILVIWWIQGIHDLPSHGEPTWDTCGKMPSGWFPLFQTFRFHPFQECQMICMYHQLWFYMLSIDRTRTLYL